MPPAAQASRAGLLRFDGQGGTRPPEHQHRHKAPRPLPRASRLGGAQPLGCGGFLPQSGLAPPGQVVNEVGMLPHEDPPVCVHSTVPSGWPGYGRRTLTPRL